MLDSKQKAALATALLSLLSASASSAAAKEAGREKRPSRCDQANDRLPRQNRGITQEHMEGDLAGNQAVVLCNENGGAGHE
ncbi:hypothetical protein [Noviherbaspirillum autotrophicum]|uniref:Secreted protein n=1 Tax=Noviherbaspirillum autotrophicum TaxID=709839 RepID=A0A0C1YMN3_9BURK|nr:hypothetical protein [Noviherbaspirillum autotrophicum]KIF81792.1 hypothetical protein TSA66_14880 [Noviherbaspirillum autotrophicum]